MERVDLIVRGEHVLPMDEDGAVIDDGAVVVKGSKIVETGRFAAISEKYEASRTIGGEGRVVMPGLINTHTHAAMALMRGLADDMPLREWLTEHIWPAESRWLGEEFIRDAVELAVAEMLKAGITTFNDMYFFENVAGETSKRLGMRAVLGAGIIDFPTKITKGAEDCLEKAHRFIDRWMDDGLIIPAVAPHAVYSCSPATLRKARALARRHGLPLHIHLSETKEEVDELRRKYGKPPAIFLDDEGFLGERVLAAHCVWVTDEEIEVLARRGVGVAHCPESNLKLASGIAPVPRMLEAGVKIGLGTDGAASNNDLNIISEMSTAAKLHKAVSMEPAAVNSRQALMMATRWGAEALGLGDRLGSLEPGKAADIITIDVDKPHMQPMYNVYSHAAYTMRASDVDTVIVNGRVVVSSGRLQTADEGEILAKAKSWGLKIRAVECGEPGGR